METASPNYTSLNKVADIAIDNPLTTRIFHSRGIDFCCGGQVSLQEACEKKGIAPDEILEEIASLEQGPVEFKVTEETRTTDVINYIMKRFHNTLKEEIPTLKFLANKVANVHGAHYPHLPELKIKVENLIADLEPHMQKEEMVLFPLIQNLEHCAQNSLAPQAAHCGSVKNPIGQMEYEHDDVGNILKDIRSLTSDFTLPEGACNSFRGLYAGLEKLEADLHLHIHSENNILHPMAVKLEQSLG